jgi:hypothetical protein
MTGGVALSFVNPAPLPDLADDGVVVFTTFLGFTFFFAGLGLNGAGFSSTGGLAAVL